MAQAKGYTCDHPDCKTFQVSEVLPINWITMRVQLEQDKAATGAANSQMEFCSNYCLALLAIERTEADGKPIKGKTRRSSGTPREYSSPEALAAAQRNGRRTSHIKYHQEKGVLQEDCEFCQEITAPPVLVEA